MKDASFFWIIISIISFVVELITPTFFFLSIAFAGVFAWLISFLVDSLIIQVLTFLVFFLIFFFLIKPVLYKNKNEKFNSDLLIGKIVFVREDISDKKGSVDLNGSIWQARSEVGVISKDSKVLVKRLDGNKLVVTKEE
jgi:membrane protein implicated in regulation of membrane protease activity